MCVPGPWEAWRRSSGNRGNRNKCCSEAPIQRMGHRALGTQTAKDQMTALNVSLLVGSASRSHHYWGFCLLLHGQDTTDTSVDDAVLSAIPPSLALESPS